MDDDNEEEQKKDDTPEETFIEVEEEQESPKVVPMMFDDDDFQEDENTFSSVDNNDEVVYKREERNYLDKDELYSKKNTESFIDENKNKSTYSYSKTSYYEEKETKGFKPSPIISPIYGILDKNYRKEEVITKRETRISTSYSKPDFDTVRKKAFDITDEKQDKIKDKKNVENKYSNDKEDRKVYDVNNDKPHVDKVTIADAEEYYNDLGLAYNVDYSDASQKNETRSSKYNHREKKKEKKDVDDNLFDLIDSMYNMED